MKKLICPLLILFGSCSVETPIDIYILPEECKHTVKYNEKLQRIEVKVVSSEQFAYITFTRGDNPHTKKVHRDYFNCISLNATNVSGVTVLIETEQVCLYTL